MSQPVYKKITPPASRKGYTGPDDDSSSIFNYFAANSLSTCGDGRARLKILQ
jgi:hypothetical protein